MGVRMHMAMDRHMVIRMEAHIAVRETEVVRFIVAGMKRERPVRGQAISAREAVKTS